MMMQVYEIARNSPEAAGREALEAYYYCQLRKYWRRTNKLALVSIRQ